MSLFGVKAFGDRLLTTDGKIRYIPFFESDEDFNRVPITQVEIGIGFAVFKTPNGFHVIGDRAITATEKIDWYDAWKKLYPNSDYPILRWNWIHSHSDSESEFIAKIALKENPHEIPAISRYYRDKRIWENLGV